MMKKRLVTVGSLVVVAMMAGCGGGSGSPSAITGKVADGYLVGATVFLDRNGNYQLDADEPSTTTDANGSYKLVVDPADIGKYPVVALAIKGMTMDKDTNQPVPNSYVLSLPKDAVSGTVSSNFISPMSSQVREMMETGKYATIGQAMAELRGKLGMPADTNLLADYMAAQNGPMHSVAQNMASLMGEQMSQVFSNHSSATKPTKLDVNRYRGMMGSIFSNMSTVKGGSGPSMTTLMFTMTSTLENIQAGQPFRNMSSSFRGMMGGTVSGGGTMTGGGMMGNGSGGSMMGGK